MSHIDAAAIVLLGLIGLIAFWVKIPDGNGETVAAVIGALAGFVSRSAFGHGS